MLLFPPKKIIILSLNIDFDLANSADSDEMPQYAAFNMGLHNLSSYPFRVFSLQWVKPTEIFIWFNAIKSCMGQYILFCGFTL